MPWAPDQDSTPTIPFGLARPPRDGRPAPAGYPKAPRLGRGVVTSVALLTVAVATGIGAGYYLRPRATPPPAPLPVSADQPPSAARVAAPATPRATRPSPSRATRMPSPSRTASTPAKPTATKPRPPTRPAVAPTVATTTPPVRTTPKPSPTPTPTLCPTRVVIVPGNQGPTPAPGCENGPAIYCPRTIPERDATTIDPACLRLVTRVIPDDGPPASAAPLG